MTTATATPATPATVKSNLPTVNAIGKGARLTETATAAIVATLPDTFDPAARGAVADAVHAWACGTADRPAVKVGPKGDQRATDYGRGVDALVKSVKRALAADAPKVVALRATLSGEGGGTVTVDMSTDLGRALVALIRSTDGK